MSSLEITQEQALRFALARHRLSDPLPAGALEEVARAMAGVQAQADYAPMFAFRARLREFRAAELDEALYRSRRLVRLWAMRGTMHLVPRDEAHLYLNRLDEPLGVLHRAVYDLLRARPMSRRELRAALVDRVTPAEAERLRHGWLPTVALLCRQGLAVHAGQVGGESTFAPWEDWLGEPCPKVEEEERDAWLLANYLRRFAPASRTDARHWSGLPAPRVSAAWGRLALVPVRLQALRSPAYALAEDEAALRAPQPDPPPLVLLGKFDTLLLGWEEKSRLLDPAHRTQVFTKAGYVQATVLLDGRVAGTWRHDRTGKALRYGVRPFRPFTAAERRRLEREFEQMTQFLGFPAHQVAYEGG